jgi:hypothetical protein
MIYTKPLVLSVPRTGFGLCEPGTDGDDEMIYCSVGEIADY